MYLTPSGLRRIVRALCASVTVVAACTTDESPTAPSGPSNSSPELLIRDGANLGVVGFYWSLPTLTKRTIPKTLTADPDIVGLDPVVTIRLCSDDNCTSVGATVRQFSRSSTPALTFTKSSGQYQVSWDTRCCAPGTYRIDVEAGAPGFRRSNLGIADVKLFAGKVSSTTQRIGWKQGTQFPIAFWVAVQIAGSVSITPATATISPGGSQQFTATLRNLHGALLGNKTISWQTTSTPATGVIASLTPPNGPTNGSGQAATTVTAGGTPGTATLYAISSDQAAPDSRVFSTAAINVALPGWTALDLDEGSSFNSYATGINDQGQVVGYFEGPQQSHAAIWQNGTRTDLMPDPATYSQAMGVNDAGQVVGYYNGQNVAHAVVWQPDGSVTELAPLSGGEAVARDINAAGDVAGNGTLEGNLEGRAVLWQGGTPEDLGTLGGFLSVATALNNNGQVVGWSYTTGDNGLHAFLWAADDMHDLGTLGGTTSEAHGINDAGQVVGFSTLEGDAATHAVLWEPDGTKRDLGTLGGTQSLAYAINSAGQVAGYSTTADGQYHAFRWEDGVMTDITVVGERTSVLDLPAAINEAGDVAGQSTAATNRQHATLWTAP